MTIPHLPVFIIACLGSAVSLWLVFSEATRPGFCPRLAGLPACYLVEAAFILTAVSCVIPVPEAGTAVFLAGAVPGFLIAVWFSSRKLLGKGFCPVLLGIPLCFASLAVFTALIILRFYPV